MTSVAGLEADEVGAISYETSNIQSGIIRDVKKIIDPIKEKPGAAIEQIHSQPDRAAARHCIV